MRERFLYLLNPNLIPQRNWKCDRFNILIGYWNAPDWSTRCGFEGCGFLNIIALHGWEVKIISSLGSIDVSPSHEVSCVNDIFDLNEVLVITSFKIVQKMGPLTWHQKPFVLFRSIVLRLGLKVILERCMAQFSVYIWLATQCHNINNYLDQNPSRNWNCFWSLQGTWLRVLHEKTSFSFFQSWEACPP